MIYLDNAATTFPKPEEVYTEVDKCLRHYCANPGRGGHKLTLRSGEVILRTREAIASLINARNAKNIVLTFNATHSLNIAIRGFLKPGDHVITTSMEHNSVIRPLKTLEQGGVELTIVDCNKNGEVSVEEIEKSINEHTKLIVTTHASNVTGTLFDLKSIGALAKKKGVRYLVDASQTIGVFDIDVEDFHIDMLAFTGHKSLFGPQGTGGLYVRDGVLLGTIMEGGTGGNSELLLQPEVVPDRFESGTLNTPGFAGLLAGIEFIKKTGMAKIREHETKLCEYFFNGIKGLDTIETYGITGKMRSPVVSLNFKDVDAGEVSHVLDNTYDIATRSGLHCAPLAHKTIGTLEKGTVRFSFGYFNTFEEVDAAINALTEIHEYIKKSEKEIKHEGC